MSKLQNGRWAHYMLILAMVWTVGTAISLASPAFLESTAIAGESKTANPCNPCAAKNPCNPCNPCAAQNPCNPCAAAANPCNPCNPCAAAANPCNPCNPCKATATNNPCNPCNPRGSKK